MRPDFAASLRLVATIVGTALLAGCVTAPAPDRLFSPAQLSDMVTGRTLAVQPPPDGPAGTWLYLAPDGTGWLSNELFPGLPPEPGGLSAVIAWRIADRSRVCVWATPRIGKMPSLPPPFRECIQVLRARPVPGGLTAVVTREDERSTGGLALYQGNAFSPGLIDQYLAQVRVLHGGHIPAWPVPGSAILPE